VTRAALVVALLAGPARAAVVAPPEVLPAAVPAGLPALPALAAPLAPASALPVPPPAAAAAATALVAAPAAASFPDEAPRSAVRLQVLSAEELGLSPDPEAPRPPSGERPGLLYRHYRLLRRLVVPFLRLGYRVSVDGRENLPDGPAVIVPNHVSYLDPVLVSYAADRPMRFLMSRPLYEAHGLGKVFGSMGVIPISHKDPKPVIEESLNRARRALAAGESVVIFPEGRLSVDGSFSPFRGGFERIVRGLGVPVVPARVDGMWGSAFSRHPERSWLRSLARRLIWRRRRVRVRLGPPLPYPDAALARDAVGRLASRP
jgi:1-acyl-sn-glycerol-3-phosphate acyltransferase